MRALENEMIDIYRFALNNWMPLALSALNFLSTCLPTKTVLLYFTCTCLACEHFFHIYLFGNWYFIIQEKKVEHYRQGKL